MLIHVLFKILEVAKKNNLTLQNTVTLHDQIQHKEIETSDRLHDMAETSPLDGHEDTMGELSQSFNSGKFTESQNTDPLPVKDHSTDNIKVDEGPDGVTIMSLSPAAVCGETDQENTLPKPVHTQGSESSRAEGLMERTYKNVKAFKRSKVSHDGKCVKTSEPLRYLTLVLFGKTSAINFGNENVLLGPEHVHPTQVTSPLKIIISGRHLSVVDMMDLQENELQLDLVDQIAGDLVRENNIHAFILVLELDDITQSDELRFDWLERQFGHDVLPYTMILFTYDSEEDSDSIIENLMKNSVIEQLTTICSGRYHTCSKSMNNQVELKSLLEKIYLMVPKNLQPCYTAEMYNMVQKLRKDKTVVDSKRQLAGGWPFSFIKIFLLHNKSKKCQYMFYLYKTHG